MFCVEWVEASVEENDKNACFSRETLSVLCGIGTVEASVEENDKNTFIFIYQGVSQVEDGYIWVNGLKCVEMG